MKHLAKSSLGLCALLSIAHPVQALVANPLEKLSISTSIGYLTGKSEEYVYDISTKRKISQLDWKIKGDAIIKGEANYQLVRWLDFNAQGWINFDSGNALMDDYDWLNPNQYQWTHWSHHDDTTLKQASQYDFSLRAWFLQSPNYRLGGVAGYQRSLFSFNARGGCYTYNNGQNQGCFTPGVKIIGYKQTYESPYLGVAAYYQFNDFDFNGVFRISNLTQASDVDQHYLRALTFKEKGSQSDFYNLVLNAGYFVKPHFKIFAEGTYNSFPNHYASTEIIDNTTRQTDFYPGGSAGLSNTNYIIALGIQYKGDMPVYVIDTK